MSKQTKPEKADFEVGYGKPPQHGRFKPGQSGNPKGRPKGVRNFKTDVKAILEAPVRVTRDGKPRSVSTQEAALFRLREKGLGGDPRALESILRLAQTYNNEELVAAAIGVSVDDAALLEIFTARVVSGAFRQSEPPVDADPLNDTKSSGAEESIPRKSKDEV